MNINTNKMERRSLLAQQVAPHHLSAQARQSAPASQSALVRSSAKAKRSAGFKPPPRSSQAAPSSQSAPVKQTTTVRKGTQDTVPMKMYINAQGRKCLDLSWMDIIPKLNMRSQLYST